MGETVYTSRTSGGETACIRTKLSERAREKKEEGSGAEGNPGVLKCSTET